MKSYTINLGPSEKFSKKSVEVEIWDLALDLLLFVLFATPGNNCFWAGLGWPGGQLRHFDPVFLRYG